MCLDVEIFPHRIIGIQTSNISNIFHFQFGIKLSIELESVNVPIFKVKLGQESIVIKVNLQGFFLHIPPTSQRGIIPTIYLHINQVVHHPIHLTVVTVVKAVTVRHTVHY